MKDEVKAVCLSFILPPSIHPSSFILSLVAALAVVEALFVGRAEGDSHVARAAHELTLGRHGLEARGGLFERDCANVRGVERGHHAALAAGERAHGRRAEVR